MEYFMNLLIGKKGVEPVVNVQINKNTSIQMNLSDIIKEVSTFVINSKDNCKEYYYREFTYVICYHKECGHFCGYVTKFGKYTEYITNRLIIEYDIEGWNGAYTVHGGFTADFGFDCAHCYDLSVRCTDDLNNYVDWLNRNQYWIDADNGRASFKSEKFVIDELEKLIDSLIEIATLDNTTINNT